MKDLFIEFLSLTWGGHGNRTTTLEDTILDDYVISRVTDLGMAIIWLTNGNKLKIPWEWIDLFSSLNTVYGERILWTNRNTTTLDKIDTFIYKFTLLINQFNWGRGKEFLGTLGDLCNLKTNEFIEWYYTESGEKLKPLELITVDEIIRI